MTFMSHDFEGSKGSRRGHRGQKSDFALKSFNSNIKQAISTWFGHMNCLR